MSTKDYILIAAALFDAKAPIEVIESLSKAMKSGNCKFNKDKFVEASMNGKMK